jgi:hypothetical protein
MFICMFLQYHKKMLKQTKITFISEELLDVGNTGLEKGVGEDGLGELQ